MSTDTLTGGTAPAGSGVGGVVLVCNACGCSVSDADRSEHYRSDLHRYNVKRRVNGLEPISEELFKQKLSALNEQNSRDDAAQAATKCALCG
jgi:pre-60S factor REI1